MGEVKVAKKPWLLILIVLIVTIIAVAGVIWYVTAARPAPPPLVKPTAPVAPAPKPPAPPAPVKAIKLNIGSGTTGGSTYRSVAGVISVAKDVPGVEFTQSATGGPADSLRLLFAKEVQMGVITAGDAYMWWRGEGVPEKRQDIRAMLPAFIGYAQLIAPVDKPINKWSDLVGKKISIGGPGFGANKLARIVFGPDGLNILDKMTILEYGHRTSMEQVVAGALDAYWFTGFPNPTVAEFCVKYKMKLIPPTKDELKITEKIPYLAVVTLKAPKGEIYAGIDAVFETIGELYFMAVRPEVPKEVVYKIVKAYWENREKAALVFIQHKFFEPDIIFKANIPLHPGVVEYYREVGLKIPDFYIPPEMR